MTDDKEWREKCDVGGRGASSPECCGCGACVLYSHQEIMADDKNRKENAVHARNFRKALAELEAKDKEIEQLMSSPNKPEPPPRPGAGVAIWDLVINDMRERDEIGAAKYGRRLRAGDGRNSLVDAYQEALDLAVYLRKRIEEEND